MVPGEGASQSKFSSYQEHEKIKSRSQEDVDKYYKDCKMAIVSGENVPRPIQYFTESNYPSMILSKLTAEKTFVSPTPIQSATWPIALQGRDLIGIA